MQINNSCLAVKLMDAIEDWKITGKLPNGEFWIPSRGIKCKIPFESRIHMSSKGALLSDYYMVVCSRACIPKRAAKIVLLYLRDLGMIEINWHSKHGSEIYPIDSKKKVSTKMR
jgi:hypothetical protein